MRNFKLKKMVKDIISNWHEKHGEASNYPEKTIEEIATNCCSLTDAWFSRFKPKDKISFELLFFDKEGVVVDTIHGITKENLPQFMFDTIMSQNGKYSKLVLNSFIFTDGIKSTNYVGELGIS